MGDGGATTTGHDAGRLSLGALGLVVAVIGLPATFLAAKTGFSAVSPTRGQADAFLTRYYEDVTGVERDCCWHMLHEHYTETSRSLKDSGGRAGYDRFFSSMERIEVREVRDEGDGSFSASILYTPVSGSTGPPERTVFTLTCPSYTAFTVHGCTVDNIKIYDVVRAD